MAAPMPAATLYIGNYNLSSWSLRPYLALHHAGLAFETKVIRLDRAETRSRIIEVSPTGRVPCLHHGDLVIPDSLAICMYVADLAPKADLWPKDQAARAMAYAMACEMHSGFAHLRQHLPMDILARHQGTHNDRPEVVADIARIKAIWRAARAAYGQAGPYLFGSFSIADAMFAPVCTRFRTYGVTMEPDIAAYVDAVFAHPGLQAWLEQARAERG